MTARPPKPPAEKAKEVRRNNNQLRVAKRAIQPSRHQQLILGTLKVADLDDEEIAHRRGRNSGGTFANTASAYTPAGLLRSMANEADRRAIEKHRAKGPEFLEALGHIALDPSEDTSDRLRALSMSIERAYGKVPDKLVVSVESTWDELDDVEVWRGDDNVVEGEVLDSSDD